MAHEAEALERAALEDLHVAATPAVRAALALRGLDLGAAFVSLAPRLPASAIVVNRAIGVGLGVPETKASAVRIVDAYRDAGVARFFVQVHPEAMPPGLVDWLLAEGLERARGWQKFSRGRDPVRPAPTDLAVREVGPEHGEDFARIVCDAFDLGAAAVPWLAALPGRPGWHVFMSFDGERPAGAGALFVRDALAWTDFGATAPAFRRRGSQGALLAHRVERALDLGCERVLTCTGEAVPGDPQHSYANILRAGFREDYVRDNYAPPRR